MAKEELQTEESIKDKMEKAFKKGSKRHRVAVQKKKEREGKAVTYAAMAQSYEPELEMVEDTGSEQKAAIKDAILQRKEALKKKMKRHPRDQKELDRAQAYIKKNPNFGVKEEVVSEGDVHSGQGEKIQKRTKKWMDKKGQKGAPGLDAIRARAAEHRAKRGVKEDWKPEIEHSKLGDAVKKKREKKRKEAESSLPPHLKLDVMKRAFAATNKESYEIDPAAHKAAQKKTKMRNLARGNENSNEKRVAQKKAGGPTLVGEEGAPTMSTGSTATSAGFSDGSDENGPTAGMSQPLGALRGKPRGRGPKLKRQKYKCRTDEIGNKICTTEAHLMGDSKKVKIMSGVHDTRYWPHIVELDGTPGTDFVFYGRSPADVKLRLRKIYRPEQHKNMKVKRISPGEAIKYHWNKKLDAS